MNTIKYGSRLRLRGQRLFFVAILSNGNEEFLCFTPFFARALVYEDRQEAVRASEALSQAWGAHTCILGPKT